MVEKFVNEIAEQLKWFEMKIIQNLPIKKIYYVNTLYDV